MNFKLIFPVLLFLIISFVAIYPQAVFAEESGFIQPENFPSRGLVSSIFIGVGVVGGVALGIAFAPAILPVLGITLGSSVVGTVFGYSVVTVATAALSASMAVLGGGLTYGVTTYPFIDFSEYEKAQGVNFDMPEGIKLPPVVDPGKDRIKVTTGRGLDPVSAPQLSPMRDITDFVRYQFNPEVAKETYGKPKLTDKSNFTGGVGVPTAVNPAGVSQSVVTGSPIIPKGVEATKISPTNVSGSNVTVECSTYGVCGVELVEDY